MAFKLTREDTKRRDEIVAKLESELAKLNEAVEKYNAELDDLKRPVEEALAAYNEIVNEARGFAEDIASQADSDIGEKSDKWQEGERGQAAVEWKDQWEALDLTEIEIDFPEVIDAIEADHAETLRDAPEEMESV